ncbi:hypothetical protein [Azospirillum argentinense]
MGGSGHPARRYGLWDGAGPPKVDMTMHGFRHGLKHRRRPGRRLVRYNRQASARLCEDAAKGVPADQEVARMIISYHSNRYYGWSLPFPVAGCPFICVRLSGNWLEPLQVPRHFSRAGTRRWGIHPPVSTCGICCTLN